MDATSSPPIIGNSRTPDSVGLTPLTICRNRGRKVKAPNMAKPTTKPMALAEVNTRLPKSLSGMTGSAARRSAQRKRPARTTPPTPRPTMNGEPHG